MNFDDLRNKRLNYLSSNRCIDNENTIVSTKFGKEVFVSINCSSGVLEIFEINNVFEYERRSMMIGWKRYDYDILIYILLSCVLMVFFKSCKLIPAFFSCG